ncbi:hypothetical protein GGH92_008749, partial [Coemansia sp. RSA 2673]
AHYIPPKHLAEPPALAVPVTQYQAAKKTRTGAYACMQLKRVAGLHQFRPHAPQRRRIRISRG